MAAVPPISAEYATLQKGTFVIVRMVTNGRSVISPYDALIPACMGLYKASGFWRSHLEKNNHTFDCPRHIYLYNPDDIENAHSIIAVDDESTLNNGRGGIMGAPRRRDVKMTACLCFSLKYDVRLG